MFILEIMVIHMQCLNLLTGVLQNMQARQSKSGGNYIIRGLDG